jgi:hypothetical protein
MKTKNVEICGWVEQNRMGIQTHDIVNELRNPAVISLLDIIYNSFVIGYRPIYILKNKNTGE